MKRSEFLKTLGLGLMTGSVLTVVGQKLYNAGSGEKIKTYNSKSFGNLRINDTVVMPGGKTYVVTFVWTQWVKLESKDPQFPNIRLEKGDKFFLIPNI